MAYSMDLSALDFSGKSVWVTGAGRGIGRCVADGFRALGAAVTGFDRAFAAADYSFVTRSLDIADAAQVAESCGALLRAEKGPQILVNAAGVLRLGSLENIPLADWQACFDVNVSGTFYLLRQLIPHFRAQRRGAIVTVASNAARVPRMQMGAYCASKAALASLSHCAGLELAQYGVRCNLVSPGSTDTPMLRDMPGGEAGFARTIAGLPEQYKLGIPLQKIATVEEIANTVIFLASDLASHITLQDIVVDGGATLAA
ncbi:2,3-dihydro-2,3-dihydroxybenzoate dehydrogenase [Microbulbifer litoralis]|uniref:2,3-dihydro-2,3-dihydroxybenzoate dehydrogenase n=1 Tax=Microbulbifer litoralis TaxID=2933965 RepID=UPI0020277213|nr:2,3-dihydro-2,3-dihydroxybenzoate dehydrogenase [Microbulbifer sp. GX H0434]